jgi:hypothetical protein
MIPVKSTLDYRCFPGAPWRIKAQPSVTTQATRLIENLLRDWSPGELLIATGDHDAPHLIDGLDLPPPGSSESVKQVFEGLGAPQASLS